MRGRMISFTGWIRLTGYGLVAAALVIASLHIHHMEVHRAPPTSPSAGARADEIPQTLARCRDVGASAQDTRTCADAWDENRRRFFLEGKNQ